MVIDSSAIVAILLEEADAERFANALVAAPLRIMSRVTYVECAFVMHGRAPKRGLRALEQLIEGLPVRLIDFDAGQMDRAVEARCRYGKGSGHRAGLNLGDCFSYALAKSRSLPLLFQGMDFAATDVEAAIP
ncbi:type II toxin-antitoxin system VapC family toxin [Salaquimonas pukyongi]|uniref:type II toxin-antitoxin system VapC family toxin n=1 Tax=Salaquimonas pukyongi TaxID=2712698 RepID=UPI00096B7D5E|nr:type II toxin-antitoxin system VapC family toxin [Salaquimonas pukyongi]